MIQINGSHQYTLVGTVGRGVKGIKKIVFRTVMLLIKTKAMTFIFRLAQIHKRNR